MQTNEFYKPTDADVLQMENELLNFENQFLKAKLAEANRQTDNNEDQSYKVKLLKKIWKHTKPSIKYFVDRFPSKISKPIYKLKPSIKSLKRKMLL